MQEFDYSNETSNDLYDAVDGLSYEEAVSAKAAIEKIKEEKEEKKVMKLIFAIAVGNGKQINVQTACHLADFSDDRVCFL